MPLGKRQPPAACPDLDPDRTFLIQSELGRIDPGVSERFACRGESERDGAGDMFAVLRVQFRFPVKILDRCRDLDRMVLGIKALDPPHTALALGERPPILVAADADGGHTSHSRDDDPPRRYELFHGIIPGLACSSLRFENNIALAVV